MSKKVKKAKKAAPKKTLGERVIASLTKYGSQQTDELAKRLKAEGSSVSKACSRLHEAGRIYREDGAEGRGTIATWSV